MEDGVFPTIYTEKKDGVLPEYDIRTDRFEVAIEAMDKINQQKAELLYGVIDNSGFYRNDVAQANRSRMNVPFQLADSALDKLFLEESFAAGLHALKGHRVVGGMRASIYNAMPLDGVKALTDFMLDFERRHG